MGFTGWIILLVAVLAAPALFYSVNAVALRTFSRVKLLEAFKASGKEARSEEMINLITINAESLILTCLLFRLFHKNNISP